MLDQEFQDTYWHFYAIDDMHWIWYTIEYNYMIYIYYYILLYIIFIYILHIIIYYIYMSFCIYTLQPPLFLNHLLPMARLGRQLAALKTQPRDGLCGSGHLSGEVLSFSLHIFFPRGRYTTSQISIYWECHHPNWRSPSFFRGIGQPPTSYPNRYLYRYYRYSNQYYDIIPL